VAVAPVPKRVLPGVVGLARAARAFVPPLVFGLLPLAVMVLYVVLVTRRGVFGYDFRHSFWPAGQAVLHGNNPYPPVDAHVLGKRTAFVYPPIVAIAMAPFALLPVGVATVLAVLLTAASLPATLWVLGVRDWRCYTVTLACPPMLACMQTAAISAPLALAIALAWRARATGWGTPAWIVVMIAAKLFLWPVLIWLALVRGIRCALLTAAAAAIVVVAPWLLGFPGERQYPRLLSLLTDIESSHAYTPRSLALSLGAGTRVAEAVAIIAGGAVLLLAVAFRNRPGADRRTLALTLLAALLLSPIVWSHYVLVLLPPIAIASRRLGAVWFVPWGFLFAGDTWLRPSTREISIALLVMVVTTALVLRQPRSARATDSRRRALDPVVLTGS
jgi:alpha-1,2-mannosyltransferase